MTILIRIALSTFFCLVIYNASASETMNENKQQIVVALGSANIFDSSRYAGYGLEYRFPTVWRKLRPIVGFSSTLEHDQYVYLGVRYFVYINDVWQFNPTFAVGLFDSGDGINLGGSVEFRSGFEFSRRMSERMYLGVGLSHLSNSRIYRSNPGTETVQLSLAIAF